MQDYVLFTDSTTDLSPALIEEMDAVVMPLSFTLNDKSYQNHPDGREMPMADFYTALRRITRLYYSRKPMISQAFAQVFFVFSSFLT